MSDISRHITLAALACSLAVGVLGWAVADVGAATSDAAERGVGVPDLTGRIVHPFDAPAGTRATVFVFVSTDCPISNRYAPDLRRLYQSLASERVVFWLVYPNASDSSDGIGNHLRTFASPLPALRDPDHALVKLSGVTVTPEVAVYDARQRLAYRGRIDNRYASLGVVRPKATSPDLERAIRATLSSERVPERITRAIGCFIEDVGR